MSQNQQPDPRAAVEPFFRSEQKPKDDGPNLANLKYFYGKCTRKERNDFWEYLGIAPHLTRQ